MSPNVVALLKAQVPDAEPDTSLGYPTCSEDRCKSYDGKRCRLTGFRPGGTCEPAMNILGAIIESFVFGAEELE